MSHAPLVHAFFVLPMVSHIVWGVGGFVWGNPRTAETFVLRGLAGNAAPYFYLVAVVLAVAAIVLVERRQMMPAFLCIVPQQLLLMFSAGGVVAAAIQQQYPNGVASPWHVIVRDEIGIIVLAVVHILVVMEVFAWPIMYRRWWRSSPSSSRSPTRSS